MAEMTLPKISKGVLAYLISIAALGCAEYFKLEKLEWIALVMSILTSLSLIVTLAAYSYNCCKNKK